MANYVGTEQFPTSAVAGWPSDLKAAYARRARAGAAVRLYRRRGWNPRAVLYQLERERAAVATLEARYLHEYENPRLF